MNIFKAAEWNPTCARLRWLRGLGTGGTILLLLAGCQTTGETEVSSYWKKLALRCDPPAAVHDVEVMIDDSGSMRGFVERDPSRFREIVGALYALSTTTTPEYVQLSTLRTFPTRDRLTSPDFYRAGKTNISAAFRHIAAHPGPDTFIFLTDFEQDEDQKEIADATEALQQIMCQRPWVEIVGYRLAYPDVFSRPLYIVVFSKTRDAVPNFTREARALSFTAAAGEDIERVEPARRHGPFLVRSRPALVIDSVEHSFDRNTGWNVLEPSPSLFTCGCGALHHAALTPRADVTSRSRIEFKIRGQAEGLVDPVNDIEVVLTPQDVHACGGQAPAPEFEADLCPQKKSDPVPKSGPSNVTIPAVVERNPPNGDDPGNVAFRVGYDVPLPPHGTTVCYRAEFRLRDSVAPPLWVTQWNTSRRAEHDKTLNLSRYVETLFAKVARHDRFLIQNILVSGN